MSSSRKLQSAASSPHGPSRNQSIRFFYLPVPHISYHLCSSTSPNVSTRLSVSQPQTLFALFYFIFWSNQSLWNLFLKFVCSNLIQWRLGKCADNNGGREFGFQSGGGVQRPFPRLQLVVFLSQRRFRLDCRWTKRRRFAADEIAADDWVGAQERSWKH